MSSNVEQTLTATQAKRLEYGIIGLCVVAMGFIFQPFSQCQIRIASRCIPLKPCSRSSAISIMKRQIIVAIDHRLRDNFIIFN